MFCLICNSLIISKIVRVSSRIVTILIPSRILIVTPLWRWNKMCVPLRPFVTMSISSRMHHYDTLRQRLNSKRKHVMNAHIDRQSSPKQTSSRHTCRHPFQRYAVKNTCRTRTRRARNRSEKWYPSPLHRVKCVLTTTIARRTRTDLHFNAGAAA